MEKKISFCPTLLWHFLSLELTNRPFYFVKRFSVFMLKMKTENLWANWKSNQNSQECNMDLIWRSRKVVVMKNTTTIEKVNITILDRIFFSISDYYITWLMHRNKKRLNAAQKPDRKNSLAPQLTSVGQSEVTRQLQFPSSTLGFERACCFCTHGYVC